MLAKQGANVDKVLNFAIDDAILEERITGRWIHPASGRTYHTKFAPPKAPGVDDVSLIQSTYFSAYFMFAWSYLYYFYFLLVFVWIDSVFCCVSCSSFPISFMWHNFSNLLDNKLE